MAKILFRITGALIFMGALCAALLFVYYCKRKIGGMTGDTIGALNEIAEVSVLLFTIILL